MSKCKHESRTGYMWREASRLNPVWPYGQWVRAFRQPGDLRHHDRVICDSCGAWLSLGEANDTPETAVEIRAAAIAQDVLDEDPNLDGDIAKHVSFGEGVGWWTHSYSHEPERYDRNDPLGFAEAWGGMAGYLARCIATHSEDA